MPPIFLPHRFIPNNSNVGLPEWCARCCACKCLKRNNGAEGEYDNLKELEDIHDNELQTQMSSFWFKSAQFSTTTLNSVSILKQ
jgi:hypothetical protein